MNFIFLDTFIKNIGITLCTYLSYFYIINFKKFNTTRKTFILISTFLIPIFYSFIHMYISNIACTLFSIGTYSIFLSVITKNKLSYSVIITIVSISISYIAFIISSSIIALPISCLDIYINYSSPFIFLIFVLIQVLIVLLFFKIKRLKNGFTFLQNKLLNSSFNIFILTISILVITIYLLLVPFYDTITGKLIILFFTFSLAMILTIRHLFNFYQKQRLLEKTLKEYESEIKEKDEKIDKLLKEESQLIKANHEFYHRQEALKHKLVSLKEVNSRNFNEEYGEIIERIDQLTDEYKKQVEDSKALHKLPKTNIPEIDDMFSYFRSECYKNNIEFVLKVNGNIHSLINNIIPKNRLETLIGDLIRNSIIAINYSKKENHSITAILGIKENTYEFCVYDSGIEFQKETLLKLGLEKATTHKDNGGTGIGYITTFETLNSCQASLIINELEPDKNNYTKSIIIRFDGKKEYIINTYRFSEFSLIATSRPSIIVRNIESL